MPAVVCSSKENHVNLGITPTANNVPPPLLPVLPDVSLIHQSNHRPHVHNHHTGYHLLCFSLTMNLSLQTILPQLLATPVHATHNTKHLVTDTVSTQPILLSVTNMTQEGKNVL
jgi:hypothetical protein